MKRTIFLRIDYKFYKVFGKMQIDKRYFFGLYSLKFEHDIKYV